MSGAFDFRPIRCRLDDDDAQLETFGLGIMMSIRKFWTCVFDFV